jgi:hypothetical protein
MTKIHEILTLDLSEDIKNVIDLQDTSENEIQSEIESYIVTEGIAKHLSNFTNQFTQNIKETGVWISGFYGSGKSYFAKMLGYMIENPLINGTPAIERFIPRLNGVDGASLVENAVRNLESFESLVVLLDVAKQNTENGLAFTLFMNLLKKLGFRDDIYGYIEFDLLVDEKYDLFIEQVKNNTGEDWQEVKKDTHKVAKVMRRAFISMGYSESDYNDTRDLYSSSVKNFSATKFKDELEKYLEFKPDETIVFIFDEASEAIGQEKFSLLDLEGISESLSSISQKVWTIAIAQEKLDDVINNANVSSSQLTKVTDRFKTKIHLEATEVDKIIRSRLLQKKEENHKQLEKYYADNEGLIADATNLSSSFPTKTKSAEEFAAYYPFHRYQFDILQNFLFSSKALTTTQVAARGMIITTFDVLRKQMCESALYDFSTGHALCTEAQQAPPVDLVNKYDKADKILHDKNLDVDGEKLLKTIHLLTDSEIVYPTVENITKSFISDIKTFYEQKPAIEEALQLLVESKVLLRSQNNYKITSDLEGKLLEEMNDFSVALYNKKRFLIKYLQDNKYFNAITTLTDAADSFKFKIISDQEDELSSGGSRYLKMRVYSLFNIMEDRQDFIERLKLETQNDKDLINLVPKINEFSQIDRLIIEVIRYAFIEEKYANEADQNKRQIIRDFAIIRGEKESELRTKIDNAYKNASAIYMFDETLVTPDTFKSEINNIQRKLVRNTYTKRLPTQLSENLVTRIFTTQKGMLCGMFSGDEFKFFDGNGNFIGDHLKVVEEISAKIAPAYIDGKSLEESLSGPPWGYSFGTIVSTLAVLFRAGRLSVKYKAETWFSHEQTTVQEAFKNATQFKTADFKSITAALSAVQKNQAVQLLLDLEVNEYISQKIDWNINDFELADAVRLFAEHFIGALQSLNNTVENFDTLFSHVASEKDTLQAYTGKVTESNYIKKVENVLANADQFRSSIQNIVKAQKFIKVNYSGVKDYRRFVDDVIAEMDKANKLDLEIQDAQREFVRLFDENIVNNYNQLQAQAQLVKDGYFNLLKNAAGGMTHAYQKLGVKVDASLTDLKKNYPADLNERNQSKLVSLKKYCADRSIQEPRLEFSIADKNSGFSLSDMLNYTALIPNKEHELLLIQAAFVKKAPEKTDTPKQVRKIKFQLPAKKIKVREYKSILTDQLSFLTFAQPDDEIEIDIDIQK